MITCDFEQEDESSSAVLAGEGFGFGELGKRFARAPEEEPNAETSLFGGGTQEPVVTNAGKAFGEDVEKPAPDEFVGSEAQNTGLASGATGPAQADASLGIVAEEAFR